MRERENWPPGTNEESIVTPDGEKRIVEFPEPTNYKNMLKIKEGKLKKILNSKKILLLPIKVLKLVKKKKIMKEKFPIR